MRPVALLLLAAAACCSAKKTVEEKLREDPDLSQFYALLERSNSINSTLQYRHLTVFAPTNEAFQRYKGPTDEALMLYHIATVAVTLEALGRSVSSELDGNPPLWVNRRKSIHHDDIFINTAKVLVSRSNYVSVNQNNKKQVLHVIDDVLVPVTPSASSPPGTIFNPDAATFLFNSENFDNQQHRVRSFRQRVNHLKKQNIFSNEGKHTFFVPVDEGFKPQPRPDLIDARVVDGHVIPNMVLFTKATPDDQAFETLAFSDNLQVTISFATTDDGKTYIKSNTLLGDTKHATGVVLADIVKGNIPLQNGVMHLIQRPLMVVDTTVTQFLEGIEKEDGPLFKFYEVIMDLGGDFMQAMARMRDITLFAPSNEAWKDANLKNIIRNKEKLHEILNLHVVRERLPLDKITQHNMHQVPTLADRKSLYFNIVNLGSNQTLTVEGGGVNATVVQPNIAATNGIVHIINRVLGVPYTTVLQKLKTDPMLNDTYFLGRKRLFNNQLNDSTHRFTYFVPRNKAWNKFQIEYPSAYKKLFMDDFSYHTTQILERHLVISDRTYTMGDIKLLANDTMVLPTLRDTLGLRIKESDNSYYVEWQNEWIHVFRPDVECTNGIIHVIDYPFLKESDIRVTGGTSFVTGSLCIIFISYTINILLVW